MSEELRPCPFCGGTKICTEKGINLNYCDNCSAESNVEHWNNRPIENALLARAEKAETMVKRLIELGDVINGDKDSVWTLRTIKERWTIEVAKWKESK